MKKAIPLTLLLLLNVYLIGNVLNKLIQLYRLNATQSIMAQLPSQWNALNNSYQQKAFPWESYTQLQQSKQFLQSIFKAVLFQKIQWGAPVADPNRPSVFRCTVHITGFVLHGDCYPLLTALAHSNAPIWAQQCSFHRKGLGNQGLQFTCILQVATLTGTTSTEPSNLH